MLERLYKCFKEALISVVPITILILIISVFIGVGDVTILFSIGAVFLILGISLFTFGAELSMAIIGDKMGSALIKSRKLFYVFISALLIGIFITIAEPDLMVLANQLQSIPKILLIGLISLGVGIFLVIALLRIIKGIQINTVLLISFIVASLLLLFTDKSFVTIAFDAGGVTTGPMSVPFIIAMGYGFTKMRSDKKARNDTFGLIGLASLGPIIVVMILGIIFHPDSFYDTSIFYNTSNSIINTLLESLANNFIDVTFCLTPILLLFIIFELFNRTVKGYELRKIILGLLATLLGLTIFLTGVEIGFFKMGFLIGNVLALKKLKWPLIILGMTLGFLIIKVEPAIKVLKEQIADLTEGSVSKVIVDICLSVGVCLAVGISLWRIFSHVSILYFIIPGYIIALVLAYLTSDMFTSIALDAGGAASGPLTTSFLLPLTIGTCLANGNNILTDAFGIVALVSLSPLITVQLVGLIYKYKVNYHNLKMVDSLDESIVEYDCRGLLCK